MAFKKRIYLLVGPKGSGKTFIGTLLSKEFNIPFLRVEDIALQIKRERDVDDNSYVQEVFTAIEKGIRQELKTKPCLTFESTGLTDAFDRMLSSLKRDYDVTIIRVLANLDKCLERVNIRDKAIHVNVSDEQVNRINAAVERRSLQYNFIIDNNEANTESLIRQLKQIV